MPCLVKYKEYDIDLLSLDAVGGQYSFYRSKVDATERQPQRQTVYYRTLTPDK
jgi:hypothetical protein